MSASKRIKTARYVIAIDGSGVYLRRTLCVTHRLESGEAHYDTKPVKPSQVPAHIYRAYLAVLASKGRKPR